MLSLISSANFLFFFYKILAHFKDRKEFSFLEQGSRAQQFGLTYHPHVVT